MKNKEQIFYGAIAEVDENKKYIKSSILHFDKRNENGWRAMKGSLDASLKRMTDAGKGVAACYQHDESILIGVWRDFEVTDTELIGTLFFVETPFVKDTVIPQVQAGILQGASPSISALRSAWNEQEQCEDILVGVLCEISLVGTPADLRADIIEMRAAIEAQEEKEQPIADAWAL